MKKGKEGRGEKEKMGKRAVSKQKRHEILLHFKKSFSNEVFDNRECFHPSYLGPFPFKK